jgi:hypothetical protein
MLAHESVEEDLVPVQQLDQVQVALEIVVGCQVIGVGPLELPFRGGDLGR